jgi:hypothetical protein
MRALRSVDSRGGRHEAATALLLVLSGAALVVLSRADRPSRGVRRPSGRRADVLDRLARAREYLLG